MPRTNPLLLPPRHYLNNGFGVGSWLLTRDHKRIALLYLAGVTLFFFIGGAFAVMIRLELATPAGELVTDDTYNKLFPLHGVMMVFFFLIPSIPATLGNFLYEDSNTVTVSDGLYSTFIGDDATAEFGSLYGIQACHYGFDEIVRAGRPAV